ncbi:MAG TPA: hypothetical protein VK462_04625 [Nitrososphaeraceae archaeon]|nr:hypothetical protein [Nitrososphaeraceae archaeon]
MELETVLTLILGNAAIILPLFLWNRSESRADIRHMDSKLESTRELVRAIHDEVKDFHGRLCVIEERNRGK